MVIKPQPVVINLSYAREVGDSLQTIRESRQLSRDDISDLLVCSVQQVLGLESGSARYFYGSRLFAQALSRYAELLEFALDRSQLVQSGEWVPGAIAEQSSVIEAVSSDILSQKPSKTTAKLSTLSCLLLRNANKSKTERLMLIRQYLFKISMALAIGVISIFAFNVLMDAQYVALASKKKSSAQNDAPPMSVEHQPISANLRAESIRQRNQFRLNFIGQSWVQIRYINQKSIDRIYQRGESLSFDIDQFTSLVIGNVDATQLEFGGKRVEHAMLRPYTRGLVVRLNQHDVRRWEP